MNKMNDLQALAEEDSGYFKNYSRNAYTEFEDANRGYSAMRGTAPLQAQLRQNFNYAYPFRPISQQISVRKSKQTRTSDGRSIARGIEKARGRPSELQYSPIQEYGNPLNIPEPPAGQPGNKSQFQVDRSPVDDVDPAHPSKQNEQSIFIGLENTLYNIPAASANSIGAAPAPPPAPHRISSSGTTPSLSSRRVASPYYSQHTMMVSPIPEDITSSWHGSYPSSAAIRSSWAPVSQAGSPAYDSDSDAPWLQIEGVEIEGPVRQVSVGKKSRPALNSIAKAGGRNQGNTSSSSDESLQGSTDQSRQQRGSSSQEYGWQERGSIVMVPQAVRPSSRVSNAQGHSPDTSLVSHESGSGQRSYTSKKQKHSRGKPDTRMSIPFSKDRRPEASMSEAPGLVSARRIPPRLNIDAVREAEARGSLTSLPDLIRRATELAAVLETGRPVSRWGVRGSWVYRGSSGREGRDTDSLSDILASFPPPALTQPGSRTGTRSARNSQWPLPPDFGTSPQSLLWPLRLARRICGMPLWAFILLVLLAVVAITTAVVVPLQLVSLSKRSSNNASNLVARCATLDLSQNGGETIATREFRGCVCRNGFTGSSCTSHEPDESCTVFDSEYKPGRSVQGIQNATIGSALPRLLEKAPQAYGIVLDPSLLMGVFGKANLSCTLQNSLVSFNGRTQPAKRALDSGILHREHSTHARLHDLMLARRQDVTLPRHREEMITMQQELTVSRQQQDLMLARRQDLAAEDPSTTATGTSTRPSVTAVTGTPTRERALDQNTVDFARVAVLYVVQTAGMDAAETAQQVLSEAFLAGTDFGNVTSRDYTFQLNDRSIITPGGGVVGGGL